MLQRKYFIFLFLILSLSTISSAQLIKPEEPVRIFFHAATGAQPGKTVEARLEVEIKPTWHLFSQKPEIRGITPTQVKLESSKGYTIEKILFPKPEAVFSEVFGKNLNLYQETLTITLVMKINSDAAGKLPVEGTVKYQACSDQVCRPPITQKFSGVQTVL
jgi:DsbC/DsbD-like thiol-disulfide interchange protein